MAARHSFLVTGASSDLGKELVQFLIEDPQVAVVSTARRSNTQIPCESSNHRHLAGIDLADADGVRELLLQTNRWLPGIFHVINCVGYFPGFREICKTDVSEVRRVLEENVLTVHSVAAEAIPLMKARGGGHFIAFSSHAVPQAFPLMAAFSAAKAALESLIRSIANEYSKDKIVATALAVATLDTPREREKRPHADPQNWLKPRQIYEFIRQLVDSPFQIMNGNTIQLFNYSDDYFGKSYFDRLGTR